VCPLYGKAISEMTYTVSGGTLNPTLSLTHYALSLAAYWSCRVFQKKYHKQKSALILTIFLISLTLLVEISFAVF